MVFLGLGFGVTRETWFPSQKQTGADYDLPQGLKPLARHKKDFTVVQGCSNRFSNEAHWGSTFWLTGADRFSIPKPKVLSNLDQYGNTSAATIPLVLDEAVRDGRVEPGHLLATSGFGAGLSWGAALLRWQGPA